jgi:hypothetical protein
MMLASNAPDGDEPLTDGSPSPARPREDARDWRRLLHTLTAKIDKQVKAALADDVEGWIRATKDAIARQRELLIADAVFGAGECGL